MRMSLIVSKGSAGRPEALQPPFFSAQASEFSSDLGLTLTELVIGAGVGEYEYRLHDVGAPDTVEEWRPFDGAVIHGDPNEVGASGDLCHVMLNSPAPLLPESPTNVYDELYDLSEVSQGCGGGAVPLRLVGVKNELAGGGAHQVIGGCGTHLGGAGGRSRRLLMRCLVMVGRCFSIPMCRRVVVRMVWVRCLFGWVV